MTFFLIHDPRVAIARRIQTGELTERELFEIQELYAGLSQRPAILSSSKAAISVEADRHLGQPHV